MERQSSRWRGKFGTEMLLLSPISHSYGFCHPPIADWNDTKASLPNQYSKTDRGNGYFFLLTDEEFTGLVFIDTKAFSPCCGNLKSFKVGIKHCKASVNGSYSKGKSGPHV